MKRLLIPLFLLLSHWAISQNALLIPPTLSGTDINLTLQKGSHQFLSGSITQTMGANGDILGPTLLLKQGDFVNFNIKNNLGETTTIHWHGMHVSAANDGGPHTTILADETWSPSFTVMDKAAVYWYHPHLHAHTNEHVSKGIAGMIIVRDDEEAALDLPRTYGVDDFPLVLQTKDFDADNQIVVPSNSDDVAMVNATIDPVLQVPAQVVRFRTLNGSSMRTFNLGLSSNTDFYQIASDGGLLKESFKTKRVRLSQGERAELLIDFSGMEGQTVYLMSYASELQNGIYGATNAGMMPMLTLNGYKPNPLNGADYNLLKFEVGAPTANPVTTIPTTLVDVPVLSESDANITRKLLFQPEQGGPNHLNGKFLINGVSFDPNVINYTIPLNNTEIWEIRNQSGISHPFHIHDVQFNILSRNGVAPPINEQGRKDVILVRPQETIRFITKFEDFADDSVPYMYHCHLLIHEDDGMMGQFTVSSALSVGEEPIADGISLYPNPTHDAVQLDITKGLRINEITILDQLGRRIQSPTIVQDNQTIRIDHLPKGLYFIHLTGDSRSITKKVLVQ